jgi:RNA polymerase sigma factor (sigma-70 family)
MLSQVLACQSESADVRAHSLEVLSEAYYAPVYKYARIRWKANQEEALDITQGFFHSAFESGAFGRYDPSQARFRTFVRVCLDRYIAKERRRDRAQKRGGGALHLEIDGEALERELAASGVQETTNAEDYFAEEWMRHLLSSAVSALDQECQRRNKQQHFRVFELLDLAPDPEARPSYAEVAKQVGISATDVNNRLTWARRELRRLVLDKLREITATEEEFKSEAFAVLGIRV